MQIKSFKQHIQEGPMDAWSMLRHKMKSMKVKELPVKDKRGRPIRSRAIKLLKSVNKRTEVLLYRPMSFPDHALANDDDLMILQKKVVGRDLPDASNWRIIL